MKAVELALESGAEHHLVRFVSKSPHLEEYPDSICSIGEHIEARRLLASYARLQEIIDECVPGSVRYRLSIRQDDPGSEIIRRAKERRHDCPGFTCATAIETAGVQFGRGSSHPADNSPGDDNSGSLK